MTGPAFEYMLQQEDLSVVETVMRNVIVFARMRPGQKGQVMDLLGTRGLQQMHKGQQRTVPVSLLSPTASNSCRLVATEPVTTMVPSAARVQLHKGQLPTALASLRHDSNSNSNNTSSCTVGRSQ